MAFSLNDLEAKYELELDRIVKEINDQKAKTVMIQLPDGLKAYGPAIVEFIEERANVLVSIYLGDCFGACDLPETDADLVIQFGHSPWE